MKTEQKEFQQIPGFKQYEVNTKNGIVLNIKTQSMQSLKKGTGRFILIMEQLKELILLCKASVNITVNNHKDYYETVEKNLISERAEIDDDIYNEMVKRDTIVNVIVFPNTPVGSYNIYHYGIELALNEALECVKKSYKK